jgi:ribosomal protein S18 acetylase RimI-like enzyme
MPVEIRFFTDHDLPILSQLLNEANRGSYQFYPYSEDRLHKWIQDAKLQILMAEENGVVLGSAAYTDGHWGEEIDWLAVRESPDGKLAESLLLKEIEEFVKRGAVFYSIDAGSPRIDDWIEYGYKPEGGLYHMIARLNGAKPLPEVAESIALRSLRPDEEKELVEAVNAGFGYERLKVGIIERWKTENPPFTEEWVHMAESKNKIVSVVASRTDANYNKNFGGKRGYLGPAASLPEFRGKNLASALTQRAMNLLFEKGLDSVGLYTGEQNIASVTLLRKLGFQIGRHWKFMRKCWPNQAQTSNLLESRA